MRMDACCTVGGAADEEPTAGELVLQLNRVGVDRAVIHPPPRCYAWDNEPGNDLLLQGAADFPDRLVATATVNPWRSDAWEVLHHALDRGARMLTFMPGVQGFYLGDRNLDGILQRLTVRAGGPAIPVYVHTGHHSNATLAQLTLLAARFEQLNFVMGHCGSTDYWTDAGPAASVVDNIYLDASLSRGQLLVAYAQQVGWDRALMGSGFPYSEMELEWDLMRQALPAERQPAVLGGNLARLLALNPPAEQRP